MDLITGLHHVTALSSDARATDRFYTGTLGLRRVKKTVNFDSPDLYHLYYGDGAGSPGSVMTYFPIPHAKRGRPGHGEAGVTAFSIPRGSAGYWAERLGGEVVAGAFDDVRVTAAGPDGDRIALIEADDSRAPWDAVIAADRAIRGFHSVSLDVGDPAPMRDLLTLMGFAETASEGSTMRFVRPGGTSAIVDLVTTGAGEAVQGAGSVHHVAFSVPDRAAQDAVRDALVAAGHAVTPRIDRDYFYACYFRTPSGILFEIATEEPGFTRDEDPANLGEELRIPEQHAHLRERIEAVLPPLD